MIGIPNVDPRLCEISPGDQWVNEQGEVATIEGITTLVTLRFGGVDSKDERKVPGHQVLGTFKAVED